MSTDLIIAIPARLKSTRLPNKPLLKIAGKAIVAHVIERAKAFIESELFVKIANLHHLNAKIVLATDSEEIANIGRAQNVTICMTKAEHATGTDRLAECAVQLRWADDAIVLNLQGDEPLMPESCLAHVLELLLANPRAAIATLATPIASMHEFLDINVVKLVKRADGRALYFSRAPIPYGRDEFGPLADASVKKLPDQMPALRHLGLYAYRAGALQKIANAPQSTLEKLESLEQLRALDLGLEIAVALAPEAIPPGIDTPEDLKRVEQILGSGTIDLGKGEFSSKKASGWAPQKILFVCMGNICRSPLAHVYALKQAQALGFTGLEFASRATIASTAKQPADLRTQAIARAAGLNLSTHRAQQIKASEFYDYDLIIAHDDRNISDLKNICPSGLEDKISLLMSFAKDAPRADVPDPYMGDHEDFILSWRLIKQGVDALLERLRA